MSELELQTRIFQWAWNSYPELRTLFFHVPNGGKRNKVEAVQLKASGVVPGIPDLILTHPQKPALGVELKTPTGEQSPEQIKVQTIWAHNYIICREFEAFKSIFSNYYAITEHYQSNTAIQTNAKGRRNSASKELS